MLKHRLTSQLIRKNKDKYRLRQRMREHARKKVMSRQH